MFGSSSRNIPTRGLLPLRPLDPLPARQLLHQRHPQRSDGPIGWRQHVQRGIGRVEIAGIERRQVAIKDRGPHSHAVNDFVTVILTESRCLSTIFRIPRTRASNSGLPHHSTAVTHDGSVLTCRPCAETLAGKLLLHNDAHRQSAEVIDDPDMPGDRRRAGRVGPDGRRRRA